MSVATTAALTVDCRSCGKPVSTRAKPGNTIRCPSCGYAQRLRPPGQIAQLRPASQPAQLRPASQPAQLRQAAPAGSWDPPSQGRQPYHTADPCPECGKPLLAEPRGTIRWCQPCWVRVTPPGVLAPYERDGHAAATRQVRSQRERDLEAVELARRKGIMLAQLQALAGDDRLDPASLPVVEWFRDQVKDAASDHRLDELAALLPEAGIRRRHWWQGTPAAVTAGYPDDGDQGDDDGWDNDEDEDEDDDWAAVRPQRMSWVGAIRTLGWKLDRDQAGCQLRADGRPCNGPADRDIGNAWVCSSHYVALGNAIWRARKEATA